jgi:hypothetical protein
MNDDDDSGSTTFESPADDDDDDDESGTIVFRARLMMMRIMTTIVDGFPFPTGQEHLTRYLPTTETTTRHAMMMAKTTPSMHDCDGGEGNHSKDVNG